MNKTPIALAIALALSLTACGKTESPTPPAAEANQQAAAEQRAPATINTLIDRATTALFKARPQFSTQVGLDQKTAGGAYSHRLEDYSLAAETALRQAMRDAAAAIAAAPSEDKDNQRVVVNLLNYFAGVEGFSQGFIDTWMGHSPFIINQINGPLINGPATLQAAQQIKNGKDAEQYLQRLEAFKGYIAAVNDKFIADAETGWIPPKALIKSTLGFLDGYTKAPAGEHTLVSNLKTKLDKIKDLPQGEKDALLQQAAERVETYVYPGYRQVAETLRQYQAKAPEGHGIWAQPGGDKFYLQMVKSLGDTDMSPEQVHQVGLDEVARISAEMDAILKAEGYSEGSVGERMIDLSKEPRFLYADSDEGRAQLIDDLNGMIKDLDEHMAKQFATRPPYPVEVRRIPEAVEDGEAGGRYTAPTLDGSVPGIYWINLRDMNAVPKFDLRTLTYHEANPGHHWQIALNLAQDSLPLLRRVAAYNAYSEGWALYSERVIWEMGLYKDDPFGDLGRLKAEIFRAVRLVVDTGIHHKQWTREQAIDYMMANTGMGSTETTAEIERYMAWPGQALGYKLGMLKFIELRQQAREALGDKFDIREFHDLVLLSGAMPMQVVALKVQEWIASKG
ncbi:MAG: DUF885 domain-containing protein [Cellvibrionaceae bacterium]|nr:DUF885 domain-containing protein [Cellvibrionaceae bacterium]MCV6626416.1 DUF885 domain-containing protein [Cellvibrionaceae bacterium]